MLYFLKQQKIRQYNFYTINSPLIFEVSELIVAIENVNFELWTVTRSFPLPTLINRILVVTTIIQRMT